MRPARLARHRRGMLIGMDSTVEPLINVDPENFGRRTGLHGTRVPVKNLMSTWLKAYRSTGS